ncbi:MAG TPA: 2'-5' RNA ligase family protein [Casimicrobiaceae bacterium]
MSLAVIHMPESAIIVLTPEAEPLVGRFRERFDPSAKMGLSAHITVLYPFVQPDHITEAVTTEVREFAERRSGFTYRLNSTGRFADTLYLAPHPAKPFVDLVKGLVEHFPAHLPYRGRFNSIVPHLTVAHGDGLPLDELERELCGHALLHVGINASCEMLVLIENTSGLWRVREQFALSGRVR